MLVMTIRTGDTVQIGDALIRPQRGIPAENAADIKVRYADTSVEEYRVTEVKWLDIEARQLVDAPQRVKGRRYVGVPNNAEMKRIAPTLIFDAPDDVSIDDLDF